MRLTIWACLVGLAACTSQPPDDLVCPALAVAPQPAAEVAQGRVMTPEEAQIFGMGAMFEDRVEAMRARQPRRIVDVALISSGGQYGAFTAGFMTGWSENTADRRPAAFEVVTGVSTGAILAPFVFAGPDFDPALREVYDGLDEADILRRRATLELASAPSLWDPAKLEARVADRVTPELLDLIAAQADRRSLLVGTVNLSSGGFEAMDLTSQAAVSDANRMDCFGEALLASAAIPVAFPPRRINGALYVDGAARQGLFLRGLASANVRPRLHIFLNNALTFPSEEPDYSLPRLAGRNSAILSDQLLRSSAIDAVLFAQARRWEVRGILAPDIAPGPECAAGDGTKLNFCAAFTSRLFALGREAGQRRPIPWLNADQLLQRLGHQP